MQRRNVEARLTPFEHYMFADDRQMLPMRFGFRIKLRGQLNLVRLRDAFNTTVREQPLFCATISRSSRFWLWPWSWKLEDARLFPVTNHPGWQTDQSQMRWDFDLDREPGIRANITQSPDSIEIWLLIHHSCADARSAIRFLSAWFRCYDQPGTKLPSPANLIEEMAQRGIGRDRPLWHYLFPYGRKWHRLWSFYANPIKPLRVRQKTSAETLVTNKPSFISRRIAFSPDDWTALKTALPGAATMNDVVLAIVFVTIKDWNTSNGSNPKQDWIRISMPMDVSSERTGLSTNQSSMVFLDRRADRIKDIESLIKDIHLETMKIKRHDLGFVFTDVLRILNGIPGGMKLGLLKSFACTTVVSNLGILNEIVLPRSLPVETKTKLEEFDFLVPVRRGTAAAIGIATAEGTLHVCMNYDPNQLPPESAKLFFAELGNRLEDFLNVKPDTRRDHTTG